MSWGSTLAFVPYGGLVADDWQYHFTPADARWACAALFGESESSGAGPEGDVVLWTWAQRQYMLRNKRDLARRDGYVLPWPHSYADIVLAHSQVVNPYWRTRGDEHLIDRRAEILAMDPRDFPPGLVERVVTWMMGMRPMHPFVAGLVDFAACDCVGCGEDTHGPADLRVGSYPRGNCFWKADGTRGWTVDTLRPVRKSVGSPLVPLSVGVGLFGLYLLLSGKSGGWLTAAAVLPFVPP